jgi:hypothetical protein
MMKRRAFLKSAGMMAAAAVASAGTSARGADVDGAAVFELRSYHFASAAKRQAFEQFIAYSAVAAWNRAGVRPVGAFALSSKDNPELKLNDDSGEVWVFLPHASPAAMLELESRLAADKEFQTAAEHILTAPKSDPAYTRFSSILLAPMSGSPRVATPRGDDKGIFELRTYESPTIERHRNKLDMFNAGEFGAFDRAGMRGVFFGGAVIAPDMPQLTYMILHPDEKDVKKNWAAFGADAQWTKLKADPRYKDNVSKITRRFVRAVNGSQI